jgi:hypothetical protein
MTSKIVHRHFVNEITDIIGDYFKIDRRYKIMAEMLAKKDKNQLKVEIFFK